MKLVASCSTNLNLSELQTKYLINQLKLYSSSESFDPNNQTWPSVQAMKDEIRNHLKLSNYHELELKDIAVPVNPRGQPMVLQPSNSDKWPIVYYHSLLDTIQELMMTIAPGNITLHHVKMATRHGERQYRELYHSQWWADVVHQSRVKQLVAVIVFSDATSVNFNGRSMHPVYITLGNFPRQVRNSVKGKRLLGFIPHVSPKGSYHSHNAVRAYRRQVGGFSFKL